MLSQSDDTNGLQVDNGQWYPLSFEQDRKGGTIKWLGSLDELKSFANKGLKLLGKCCSALTNGGFFVLKSYDVTISFYPNTKTLNVQGTKMETIKVK